MVPLLACSVLSLAVILERAVHFLGTRTSRSGLESALASLRRGDTSSAQEALESLRGPVASLAAEALRNRSMPRAELESRLSLVGSSELKRLSLRLHWLELIGRISPMLGLVGTVLGLTRTFRAVAAVRHLSDPSLLASGIWEALITTVAGLFIGIPTLVFYHLYQNRLRSLSFEMKTYGEEVVAMLEEGR
jgi:biopolymer transport protein ExbB